MAENDTTLDDVFDSVGYTAEKWGVGIFSGVLITLIPLMMLGIAIGVARIALKAPVTALDVV